MSWPTSCWSSGRRARRRGRARCPRCSRSTKPPRRPREQECSRRPGSSSSRCSVKPGKLVGGEVLERAEVDDQLDRLVVGPHVGAAVDPGLEDRQVGDGRAHAASPSDGWRARRRRRTVGRDVARRRCREPTAAGRVPRTASSSSLDSWRSSAGAWRHERRSVRSKHGPAGSTCSTTPETSSGAVRAWPRARWRRRRGRRTRSRRRGRRRAASRADLLVTTAAVSSSIPMPSRPGLWATSISSRP